MGKDIENRTWRPPRDLIGRHFVVHGGKVPTSRGELDDIRDEAREMAIEDGTIGLEVSRGGVLMTGLVAVVRLVAVVTTSSSRWFEGPIGWQIDDLFVLPEPIACKGRQGLWEIPAECMAEVGRQWRERA